MKQKRVAREERFIGATPAVLSVLHPWNGRLGFHPHVHLLISGGGVSDDGLAWREANASFLVPVKRLSKQIAKSLRKAIEKQGPELLDEIPDIPKPVEKSDTMLCGSQLCRRLHVMLCRRQSVILPI